MRPPIFLALSVALLAAPARGGAELTAMVGYRSGELAYPTEIVCALAIGPYPCPTGARSEDGESFGLILEVPWSEDWAVEGTISHQETRLRFQQSLALLPVVLPATGELDVVRAYVGVRRQWTRPRRTPFVGAAAGLADFRPSADPVLVPEALRGAHRSATLDAGLKLALPRRLGVRLEARGHWSALPESAGGDLVQTEIAVGLSVRR
jgi:hypothetical protein